MENPNVVAIIQARLGSTRLPRKVLKKLHGQPMLWWLLVRAEASKLVNKVCVATTDLPEDDELEIYIKGEFPQIEVFRGSVNNLVDRYAGAADLTKADIIVRLTGDDPLKDPELIDQLVSVFKHNKIDYCSNCLIPTYPEGLDVEVFSRETLIKVRKNAKKASDLEHLTTYITNNRDKFKIKNLKCEENFESWRWTVDKPSDFEFITKLLENYSDNPLVSYKDLINVVKNNPSLININSGTIRFEGYHRSVEQELANEQ